MADPDAKPDPTATAPVDESIAIRFAAEEINRLWRAPSPVLKTPAKHWLGYLLAGFALLAMATARLVAAPMNDAAPPARKSKEVNRV